MPRIAGPSGGDGVQAVLLALRILEAMAAQRGPVGITELATALGTTKSRIHRHLQTLLQQGYVARDGDTERYVIGAALVALSYQAGENVDLGSAARQAMVELRDTLGHSTVVSRVEVSGLRVLSTVPGRAGIEVSVKPGSLLSYRSSAQGKVAIAFGPDSLRTLAEKAKSEPLTQFTITDRDQWAAEIGRVRAQGWAAAANEWVVGVNAIAAPIFGPGGALAGTIGIVDWIRSLPSPPEKRTLERVVAAAARISAALGYVADGDPAPPSPARRQTEIA
jgi:DNA-binding IclR family transcriptional regulator